MKVADALPYSAFFVGHPEYPELVAQVSGPYITVSYWKLDVGEFEYLEVFSHSEGGVQGSGITEMNAAQLLDEARDCIERVATGGEEE